MKPRTFLSLLLWIAMTTGGATLSVADGRPDPVGGQVLIPDTSIEHADHIGRIAHTNTKILAFTGSIDSVHPPLGGGGREIAPGSSYFETPASLGCVYRLTSVSSAQIGCNPTDPTLLNPSGGARAIAIVDAYDYPTAFSDLQIFSAQFGLPAPTTANFQVVYATGTPPKADSGWGLEAALDIEWAHAMAPHAKIYLVEAASNSYADLLSAVNVASNYVAQAGGGEVSMSWGGSEFSFERFYDGYFTKTGVVYFAAAGDSAGTIWPSTSPNVVSAGGTTNSRDAKRQPAGATCLVVDRRRPEQVRVSPILPIGDFPSCRQQARDTRRRRRRGPQYRRLGLQRSRLQWLVHCRRHQRRGAGVVRHCQRSRPVFVV